MRRRVLLVALVVAPAIVVGAVLALGGGASKAPRALPSLQTSAGASPTNPATARHPRAIEPQVGVPETTQAAAARAGAAPSGAEVQRELADAQDVGKHPRGAVAQPTADGQAIPPTGAPSVVARVIEAANVAARDPYGWGGGHGRYDHRYGFDCSGSVSYALAGAGLLKGSLDSTGFESYGKPGPGHWVTIYANAGHMFMIVAGLRYDTSGRQTAGTRWQAAGRSTSGFVVRHPPGL